MLVRIEKNKEGWAVFALSGQLYGQIIAQTEGVRLSKPRFQSATITGYLDAMYGAQVRDTALEDIDVARSLGLNGIFMTCHREAIRDTKNSGWFDSQGKQSLIEARYVTAMGERVYYSTQEDIDADRAEHHPMEIPDNAGIPESVASPVHVWTAWDHFRAFLTKLKNVIMGR